jgi:hypothetical protein
MKVNTVEKRLRTRGGTTACLMKASLHEMKGERVACIFSAHVSDEISILFSTYGQINSQKLYFA